MGSFNGVSFGERGNNAQTFPVWAKAMLLAVKPRPNNPPAVNEIGLDVQRLALVVRVTNAQLTDLYGQVHESGTLVFGYETCSAWLDSIDPPEEISVGRDIYFATLNLIRL